ncbi:type II toxin-antitoxin system RelE/ParE family toxin [Roseovarius tibetensis]|uniref:type II toxin-antitoxin system RelE/ParE family toxin n=1 Tax=Roseovarius tibetensis TaxID=2685897 RepID=UPI003D7FB112
MIRVERHPLVRRDLRELVRHVAETSGDKRAAARRLDEVEALLASILEDPRSGPYLADRLSGWRVRHEGKGRMLTIVFRLTDQEDCVQVAVVAFGGQDWMGRVASRKDYFSEE